ncbi:MAG TPA: hypothetical protein VH054_17290 [Polyangiaceae bacterium]|nr:hypothetical protein [Polyangiaceae bacterium]
MEQRFDALGCDSGAAIDDAEMHSVSQAFYSENDTGTLRREMHRVQKEVDEDLLSNGCGAHEKIVGSTIFDVDGDATAKRLLRNAEGRIARDGERAARDVRRLTFGANCTPRDRVAQPSVRERDIDRLVRRVRRELNLRSIEPTEHDGERVRYFVQRSSEIRRGRLIVAAACRREGFHARHTITAFTDGPAPLCPKVVTSTTRRSVTHESRKNRTPSRTDFGCSAKPREASKSNRKVGAAIETVVPRRSFDRREGSSSRGVRGHQMARQVPTTRRRARRA